MSAILHWGTYVPYWRLQRSAIAAAVGGASGPGTRAVASYDEDTTSMAVEAGRAALAASTTPPTALFFATSAPAYLDKTNATAIHAALGLDSSVPAYDMAGSVRSGVGALRAALANAGPVLVITSDVRTGLPSGADEAGGGDGASAMLVGPEPGAATYLGGASATAEFVDRWRLPGESSSRVWEERFGEQVYVPLAEQAVADAVKTVGIQADAVDQWIVTGTHPRAIRRVAGSLGRDARVADDLSTVIGNTGTAHPLLLLAAALEQATPGQTIGLVVLADGAEALLFTATDAVADARGGASVADQIASGRDDLPYPRFLSWRGFLDREPPRRPEPERAASPPAARSTSWKFAFSASRCVACGTRHLPPHRVCVRCGAVDQMTPEPLGGVQGQVATFTVDRLAYSQSPPVVIAVVDFDGGGRYTCELTDVDADAVTIGDRVEMTFRRLYTADGIHNYFWKARPIREIREGGGN